MLLFTFYLQPPPGTSILLMDSSRNNLDVAHEFLPFLRVYKDGRLERLLGTSGKVPASDDPKSGFRSKDATISSEPPISARIFLPSSADPNQKLPLLFYVHGGRFCVESAFNLQYHTHVGSLAAKAKAVAVSVEYRLAPEHPIPACYEDCWEALRWAAAHSKRDGPEPWLNQHADFDRICLVGDSAGANICHYLASRAGSTELGGVKVAGMAMVHPFFGDGKGNRIWKYLCPDSIGEDDPRLRPSVEDVGKLGCGRVMVFEAEKDRLKEGGRNYCRDLKRSRWRGTVETVVHDGEDHVFHLEKPETEKTVDLLEKLAAFLKSC